LPGVGAAITVRCPFTCCMGKSRLPFRQSPARLKLPSTLAPSPLRAKLSSRPPGAREEYLLKRIVYRTHFVLMAALQRRRRSRARSEQSETLAPARQAARRFAGAARIAEFNTTVEERIDNQTPTRGGASACSLLLIRLDDDNRSGQRTFDMKCRQLNC